MFQRIVDSISESAGTTIRLAELALATVIALFITISFLCAAAFILVLEKYGPVQACLTGAGIFFLLTLVAAGCYLMYKMDAERRAARAPQSVLADPNLIASGLQVIGAVDIKRLLPILALGGLVLGIMASYNDLGASKKPTE